MTKDRLKALQSVVQEIDEEEGGEDNVAIDIDDENAGYMERFYSEICQTREWINEINDNVAAIKSIHSTLLSSPRPDEATKMELEGRTNQVKALSKKISTTLKGLEKELWQEEDELSPEDRIPARLRIRRTQHAATLHLFLEAMSLFNNQQTEYREKCIERIHRLASIAKAVVSDEKIDELLEQGNYGAIFNDDIITETIEARRALEDVQVRHQELLKIEKSLVELHDLFVEMAILVEQQGDLINRIESHVEHTVEYVDEAHREMKKAIEYQRKSRTGLRKKPKKKPGNVLFHRINDTIHLMKMANLGKISGIKPDQAAGEKCQRKKKIKIKYVETWNGRVLKWMDLSRL